MSIISRKLYSNEKLGESYVELTHSSGLKICVYNKNFANTTAMLTVKFGAIDRKISTNDGEIIQIPAGTAHFLEHKMFEGVDGEDAFGIFSQYGADANAYTSKEITTYLFSTADDLYAPLDVLLDFVMTPHFTADSIEKEKDIIGQEIQAGEDSPGSRIFYEQLGLLYSSPEIVDKTCGSENDIAAIDEHILRLCHSIFYVPSNMVLALCGKVSEDKVIAAVEQHFSKEQLRSIPKRYYPEHDPNYVKKHSEIYMDISRPIFSFGIKDDVYALSEKERLKRRIAGKLLLDISFGSSSEFYNRLYEQGILNGKFSADYYSGANYAYISVSGETDRIEEFREELIKTITGASIEKVNTNDLIRMKRAMYGNMVAGFDSSDTIADDLTDVTATDLCLFDFADALVEVDEAFISDLAKELFRPNDLVYATVLPISNKN